MRCGVPIQASRLRQAWREAQGAANISLDECQVRVGDARAEDPAIRLERVNMWDSPARNMVAEMMILAGQVAAALGAPARARLFRLWHARAVSNDVSWHWRARKWH